MPRYLLVYLGGDPPASPDAGRRHHEKYRAWLDALGDRAVSPANPIKNSHIVHAKRVTPGSTTSMSGFSIVETPDMAAALAIAQACPFLEVGGTLEVSELVTMRDGD